MAKIDLSNIAITKNQKDSPLSNVDPKKTVDYARTLREKNVKPIDYAKVGQGLIDFAKTLLGGASAKKKGDKATIDDSKIRRPIPLESTRNYMATAKQKDIDKLSALSGGNTAWVGVPIDSEGDFDEWRTLSTNKLNAIKDAVKFYQKEFKMTPRADILNDWEAHPYEVKGGTADAAYPSGQRYLHLQQTSVLDDEDELYSAEEDEEAGWHPKNSAKVYRHFVPVHEFGHAISMQLFDDDTNRYERGSDEYHGTQYDKMLNLVKTAASDIGVPLKTVGQISEYAMDSPYEAVAEALADYYANRENASPLSLAIVNRLKRHGSTYGLRQAGGVRKRYETPEETLRRYKVIQ